jgi:hypothetical protein
VEQVETLTVSLARIEVDADASEGTFEADPIVACVPSHDVAPWPRPHVIVGVGAEQEVIPRAAEHVCEVRVRDIWTPLEEEVVTALSIDVVPPLASAQLVVSLPTVKKVLSLAPAQLVVSIPAAQPVRLSVTADEIVAAETRDRVVASETDDYVGFLRPGDRVVPSVPTMVAG